MLTPSDPLLLIIVVIVAAPLDPRCVRGPPGTCAENREGKSCSACKPGTYAVEDVGHCSECSKRDALLLIIVVIVVGVLRGYTNLDDDQKP